MRAASSHEKELISIVVPVYNNPKGLCTALSCISELDDDSFEVVVVDDASTHICEDICREADPTVR